MKDLYIIDFTYNKKCIGYHNAFSDNYIEHIITIVDKLGHFKVNHYLDHNEKGFNIFISKMNDMKESDIELLESFHNKMCPYYKPIRRFKSYENDHQFPSLDSFELGKDILEYLSDNDTINELN